MMKPLSVCKAKGLTLWLVLLCTTLCDASVADAQSPAAKSSRTVYICTGPFAEAYHATPHCKGLANCSGDTDSDAALYGALQCNRPAPPADTRQWEALNGYIETFLSKLPF